MKKEATRDERDAFYTLKSTQGDKDAPESHGGEQDKGHLRTGGWGVESWQRHRISAQPGGPS